MARNQRGGTADGSVATTELRITEIARAQYGLVRRSQLLELGLGAGAIQHRLGIGRLCRLHRGVYQVGPILPPRGRSMAAVLACGSDALLCDRSAAELWGLVQDDGRRRRSSPVDVLTVGYGAEPRPGVRTRRVQALAPEDRAEVGALPVTGAVRTLVDLARIAGPRELELAVARADREGLVRRDALAERVAREAGRVGMPALRRLLERTGGPALTRSEAEARFLALIREAGLPVPETNARLGGYELDFLWRDRGVAVEVDGYRFHASRSRFESDRRRATRLAAIGAQVIPVTWRQIVDEPTATAVHLAQALLRAETRGLSPAVRRAPQVRSYAPPPHG